MKKYVVLEHLMLPDRGFRFWSTNSERAGKLLDGTEAYKVVYESDDEHECIHESRKINYPAMYDGESEMYELAEMGMFDLPIKIINPDSKFFGCTGKTVQFANRETKDSFLVCVNTEKYNQYISFNKSELERI